MIAIDTNIAIRYLVGDDAAQFAVASAMFRRERIFLSLTVVLEIEWVLRGAYSYTSAQVKDALLGIMGLENVSVEDEDRLHRTFDWMAEGLTFADALHLSGANASAAFATFDRELTKIASRSRPGFVQLR